MSTTVKYKGSTITTLDNETKTLTTSGKWLEDNIEITDISSGSSELGVLSVENNYLILDDIAKTGYVNILSNNDIGKTLEAGYYQIPDGYVANISYFVPTTPQLIANWDLTNSLVDTINGETITISGATRTSSGLTFDSATDYATIPIKYRPYRTYELDISSMSKGSLNTHGRLLMMTTTEGLIYRNGTNWNVYLNGGWGTNGSTDSAIMSGHTLTMTVEADAPKFYIDGTLFFSTTRVQSFTANTNIMIGSSAGQSYFEMTITGIRVYEGVKYS